MHTDILSSPAYAALSVNLAPGEAVRAEPGAMVHMSGVALHSGAPGGLIKGLRRLLARESFFLNTFTGGPNGGNVTLAPPTPGDIHEHHLDPQDSILIQASSFLAASKTVSIDSNFQGLRGILGRESAFFLQASTLHQPGTVFFNAYGAIQPVNVAPGQRLSVDTGHLVAFTDDLDYSIGKVGGLRSLVAGGEGLVMHFENYSNPAGSTLWVQTRNLRSLIDTIIPLLPHQRRTNG